MPSPGPVETEILKRLRAEFAPTHIELINESHMHHGHGEHVTDESHFRLIMTSKKLEGLSRVRKHQAVYAVLDDLFKSGLHALVLELK